VTEKLSADPVAAVLPGIDRLATWNHPAAAAAFAGLFVVLVLIAAPLYARPAEGD